MLPDYLNCWSEVILFRGGLQIGDDEDERNKNDIAVHQCSAFSTASPD
jgi:hypothetical protein